MTQTKHTEGPWAIETPCGFPYAGIYIVSHQANKNKDFHSFIAEVRQYREDHSSPAGCGEGTANARLISQAPTLLAERDRLREINRELLAACKAIKAVSDKAKQGKGYDNEPNIWFDHIEAVEQIEVAIAKAEKEEK